MAFSVARLFDECRGTARRHLAGKVKGFTGNNIVREAGWALAEIASKILLIADRRSSEEPQFPSAGVVGRVEFTGDPSHDCTGSCRQGQRRHLEEHPSQEGGLGSALGHGQ